MKTSTYKYIIAEDESLIRKNLVKKINALNLPLESAGETANGLEAIGLIERHCPELVITDIRMPQCDGLELIKYLHGNYPRTKVVVLSGYDDFSYAQTALRYSVKDYLLKPVASEHLLEALQRVLITMGAESEELKAYHSKENTLNQEAIANLLQKYLSENYQKEISLRELGDKFGFTPEYLGKIFKKFTGETLSKYLIKLRMNEAKRLLLNSPEMSIQKVGELVGYKDDFYFSRAFKNYTGIQPSKFRIQD